MYNARLLKVTMNWWALTPTILTVKWKAGMHLQLTEKHPFWWFDGFEEDWKERHEKSRWICCGQEWRVLWDEGNRDSNVFFCESSAVNKRKERGLKEPQIHKEDPSWFIENNTAKASTEIKRNEIKRLGCNRKERKNERGIYNGSPFEYVKKPGWTKWHSIGLYTRNLQLFEQSKTFMINREWKLRTFEVEAR